MPIAAGLGIATSLPAAVTTTAGRPVGESDPGDSFPNRTGFATYTDPTNGLIDIEFAPPSPDVHFFQLYGNAPTP